MPKITAAQLATKAKAIDSAEAEYGVISHSAVDARKDFGAECVCARDHIIACLRAVEQSENDYVAWMQYRRHNGMTTIHVCDSDSPGAFKVYRSAVEKAVRNG